MGTLDYFLGDKAASGAKKAVHVHLVSRLRSSTPSHVFTAYTVTIYSRSGTELHETPQSEL